MQVTLDDRLREVEAADVELEPKLAGADEAVPSSPVRRVRLVTHRRQSEHHESPSMTSPARASQPVTLRL